MIVFVDLLTEFMNPHTRMYFNNWIYPSPVIKSSHLITRDFVCGSFKTIIIDFNTAKSFSSPFYYLVIYFFIFYFIFFLNQFTMLKTRNYYNKP